MWHPVFFCILTCSSGQKISQAGSDFYLRFRSQRFVDRPVTTRLHVDSHVRHRYAITEVLRDVHNPANEEQLIEFAVVMPASALVSEVRVRGQKLLVEKGAKVVYESIGVDVGDSSGESGGETEVGSREFVQFVLPVLLAPEENVTLSLVYENLLERKSRKYHHALNLSPGEIIYDFVVKINISENKNVTGVEVTAPVIDDITKLILFESGHPNQMLISFRMNSREQAHYFGSPGFSGTLLTQFDVTNDEQKIDIAIQDEYFVHFYTVPGQLPPIPKHVIFIVDVSESMRGSMVTVSEIVQKILQSLNLDDYLNIIAFNSSIFQWNPIQNTSVGIVDQAFKCLPQVKESGLQFVQELKPRGLSDLVSGLQQGIYTGRRIRLSKNFPDNVFTMIVLLTDGHTTRPEVNIERRIRIDNRADKIPIYSLGIGTFSQDELLQGISQKSGGNWHKIKPAEDLDEQLGDVLRQFDDVVLKNVNIRYTDNLVIKESLTMTEFKSFKTGTSLVVAGQFNQSMAGSVEPVISGQFINGSYTEIQPIFKIPRNAATDAVASDPIINGTFTKQLPILSINNSKVENHFNKDSFVEQPISKSQRNDNDGVSPANTIERQWAYLIIREALEHHELKNGLTNLNLLANAVNLSMIYNFLTPFTQLVEQNNNSRNFHEFSKLMTNREDNHGIHISQSKAAQDCDPPIKCRAAFGFSEPLPKVIEEGLCKSSLSLTNLNGNSLMFTDTTPRVRLVGVAHVSQDGSCCWILFSESSYSGETQKFCGVSGPVQIAKVKSLRKM